MESGTKHPVVVTGKPASVRVPTRDRDELEAALRSLASPNSETTKEQEPT